MKQRGRVSAAATDLVPLVEPLDRVERLPVPHDLTEDEQEIWLGVINSQPADWFTEANAPLLAQLARHTASANRIEQLLQAAIKDTDKEGKPTLEIADYARLLLMRREETKMVVLLQTKLRLTPQSLTNHRGNKKPGSARKPWEG